MWNRASTVIARLVQCLIAFWTPYGLIGSRKEKAMKFKSIPKYTQANYHVNHFWDHNLSFLQTYIDEYKLDINPDFQRAHVWTEDKQTKYVEYIMRGGISGKDIYLNCPGWMKDFRGPFVLVDGKQRLEAVRRFMNNEIKAFGSFLKDFEDKFPIMEFGFIAHINDLPTRKQVLQWYIDLNDGGVVHTSAEIKKVQKLLELEK
jgi:hypothetical protein